MQISSTQLAQILALSRTSSTQRHSSATSSAVDRYLFDSNPTPPKPARSEQVGWPAIRHNRIGSHKKSDWSVGRVSSVLPQSEGTSGIQEILS
jgi:hypothetical protein